MPDKIENNFLETDTGRLEADTAFRSGDWEKAGALYTCLAEQAGNDPLIFHNIAECRYKQGNIEEAENYVQKALDIAPGMKRALFLSGEIYFGKMLYKEAMAQFRECTKIDSDDHESYFYLGNCCLKVGLPDDALALFIRAYELGPEHRQYSEAAGKIYYEKQEFAEALKYLSECITDEETNVEVLNIIAACAEKTGGTSVRKEALRLSLDINPDQPGLKSQMDDLLNKYPDSKIYNFKARKKIAVFSNIDSFLGDIIEFLETKYEVKKFIGGNSNDISALMEWSDISWFEWCDNLLVHASNLPKASVNICRMHRYEAFTDFPSKVNWKNVDHLICVHETIADVASKYINTPVPVSVIHNGLNFDRYTINEDKKQGKKIAYAGYIKKPKGIELLLQCFAAIYKYDPEYTFHIAGLHQDPEIELYFDHIVKKLALPLTFYGWVDPVLPWLSGKDYIISSSISESFQYSVVEGIASGLLPIVHNWPGSDKIYPEDCIFVTVDECLDILKRYENIDKKAESKKYRNITKDQFSLEKQLESIDALIGECIK